MFNRSSHLTQLLVACLITTTAFAAPDAPTPVVKPLSAKEEAKTFLLPEGYRLELVLSEPDIEEPVTMAFDGNGRLYVAEMRTYMQDIDGTGQQNPISRVSVHWSSQNDGVFDQHRIFADNLLLPRVILPLDDGVIIGETDTHSLYLYRDTNGDGVSDEKTLAYKGKSRGGNLEHQSSALIWGMDNTLYTGFNAYRLLRQQGNLIRQNIPANGGQWGATHDDDGKLWFVNAGGERGPVNFQHHILYGQSWHEKQFEPGFQVVWPAVGLRDYQGGPGRSRGDGTLNHFTATCGEEIYRGDRLPPELKGNLFFAEPVGRLVRRATIEVNDGVTTLRNAHPKSEFLRSTDACFRPVEIRNAPDGTLYICDMYRGIIQEGNWTQPGSYLRKIILKHGMDKINGRGRIWRLVHDSNKPAPAPRLLDSTPAQLVETLAHPNGWHRDTAQKLLVHRQERKVTSSLSQMASEHPNPLARIHALWTLEGIGSLQPNLVRQALQDENPRIRQTALRVSESLLLAGETSLYSALTKFAEESDPTTLIQAMHTARRVNWKDAGLIGNSAGVTHPSEYVRSMAKKILSNRTGFARAFTGEERRLLSQGEATFQELCFACHGLDGTGMPVIGTDPVVRLAAPLSGSKIVLGHRDLAIRAVLHGVTGPIDGKNYQSEMVAMASNDDEWIASVLSYVRNSFGNSATCVTTQDVARVRNATQSREARWTQKELLDLLPTPLSVTSEWAVTASHNSSQSKATIDGDSLTSWNSEEDLNDKMWIAITLPESTTLNAITIHCNQTPHQARHLRIETSQDGTIWTKPVFEGPAAAELNEISFEPIKARHVRISSRTNADNRSKKPWVIQEIAFY